MPDRSCVISTKVSPEELQWLTQQAKEADISPAEYYRRVLLAHEPVPAARLYLLFKETFRAHLSEDGLTPEGFEQLVAEVEAE